MNAETLIQEYSGLSRNEQAKFDRRYKDLLQFRKVMDAAIKNPEAFIKQHYRKNRFPAKTQPKSPPL